MTFDELKAQRDAILAIAERHGARDLRVFGSVVRGEADAASDVDSWQSWTRAEVCSTSGAC